MFWNDDVLLDDFYSNLLSIRPLTPNTEYRVNDLVQGMQVSIFLCMETAFCKKLTNLIVIFHK